MKRIMALLVSGICGCYVGLTGCEKPAAEPASAPEACVADIAARLQLVDSPQPPCESYVMLFRLDDRYLYAFESPICDYVPRYYTCEGVRAETDAVDARDILERATPVQRVGFLPAYQACQEETVTRLALTETPSPASCSTLVAFYNLGERDYFVYTSPVCRITAPPFDCAGEPVCEAADDRCLQDFFRRAEYVRDLGYLPE